MISCVFPVSRMSCAVADAGTACRAPTEEINGALHFLESVDEKKIGGGPERTGDGRLRAAGNYDFENLVVGGKGVQESAAASGGVGLDLSEFAQRVVDDFIGSGHGR